jgi:antitoxin ParD1/3/4
MNISLTDLMKGRLEKQAGSDSHSNTRDYLRDLVRRDQDRAAKIAHMQALIDGGLRGAA